MNSGDMRTAIKMLHEHALPKKGGSGMDAASSRNTEMLSCILGFFLDLCDEREFSSIAFFGLNYVKVTYKCYLPPIWNHLLDSN